MNMAGYTKLFSSLIHSTIWREPNYVRLVWITMLALADRDGTVEAAIPGLADAARVTLEECEDALARFRAPDKYSRNPRDGGRRIVDIEGGWRLLNYDSYRRKMSIEQARAKAAERQKRYRDRVAERAESATTESPSDHDGSPTETVIPLDLATRAEKILPEMLSGMVGVTLDQLRDGVREFVSYWTIGGGKFKKRNFWMKRLREDLRQKYERKKFRAPGEIEHDANKPEAPRDVTPGAAKLIAMAKEEDAKTKRRKVG